jgi:hypothetical protein
MCQRRLWKLTPLCVGVPSGEPGGWLLYREDQETEHLSQYIGAS